MRVVIEVPSTGGQLQVVRRFVEAWADAMATDPDNLPLVATELVSNALNASPPDTSVIVRLEREADQLRLVVMDEGPGFAMGEVAFPSQASVRGRGLALVASSVDSLTVERIDGLTVVTACRSL